jgi:hypothetical protein
MIRLARRISVTATEDLFVTLADALRDADVCALAKQTQVATNTKPNNDAHRVRRILSLPEPQAREGKDSICPPRR